MAAVAIVADDLTGAFDSAAPFAARGADTQVAVSPAVLAAAGAHAEVLSVSTASRHLPAEAAARAVTEACRALVPAKPRVWFKKIDSTLRGNVAAEALAALAASARREIVITPATPSQGRTVRGGVVHVHGAPLPETEYVRDAVSPASTLALADQLRAADPQLHVEVVDSPPPEYIGARCAWIADAETNADLGRVAAWALARADRALMVGAAGLGAALAEAMYGVPADHPAAALDGPSPRRSGFGRAGGPVVYVVGSRAAVSRRQADRLAAAGCASIEAPCGRLDAARAAALMAGREALLVRVPASEAATAPEAVAAALGEGVADLLERAHVGALLVTGGDVAAAVLAATGQPVVRLVGEVAPGVPLSRIRVAGREVWLVTKAGGFGADDLFLDLPRLLGPSPEGFGPQGGA